MRKCAIWATVYGFTLIGFTMMMVGKGDFSFPAIGIAVMLLLSFVVSTVSAAAMYVVEKLQK